MRLVEIILVAATVATVNQVSAAEPERCSVSRAGISRCVRHFAPVSKMTTITYSDRLGNVTEVEIDFTTKDGVYAAALIGATIALLCPALPKEKRARFFEELIVNAGKEANGQFSCGRYVWASAKTNAETLMVRAYLAP